MPAVMTIIATLAMLFVLYIVLQLARHLMF